MTLTRHYWIWRNWSHNMQNLFKIFKFAFLRYSRVIAALAGTILAAKSDLMNLTLMSFIGLIGFGSIAHAVLGSILKVYMTLPYAVMNLCVQMMGKFNFTEHGEAAGLPGKIFLIIFLLCGMVFLLDIFITLLNEFLSEINASGDTAHPDEEVIDYLVKNMKTFFLNIETNDDRPSQQTRFYEPTMQPWKPARRPNILRMKTIKISDWSEYN